MSIATRNLDKSRGSVVKHRAVRDGTALNARSSSGSAAP